MRDAVMTFCILVLELLPIFSVTFFFRHIPDPEAGDAARTPLMAPPPYISPYRASLWSPSQSTAVSFCANAAPLRKRSVVAITERLCFFLFGC